MQSCYTKGLYPKLTLMYSCCFDFVEATGFFHTKQNHLKHFDASREVPNFFTGVSKCKFIQIIEPNYLKITNYVFTFAALAYALRKVSVVQLYWNNACMLLLRILSIILDSDFLHHERGIGTVYKYKLASRAVYKYKLASRVLLSNQDHSFPNFELNQNIIIYCFNW